MKTIASNLAQYRNQRFPNVIAALAVVLGAQVQMSLPAVAADGVTAQHVHLAGLAFDGPATDLLESITHMCQEMGTPRDPLPAGDHPFEVTQDRYYSPSGVTIYETQKVYFVASPGCKLIRKIETKVKVRNRTKTCNIEPDRKRAVGACDITVSELMAPASRRRAGDARGDEKLIANHFCKVFEEQFSGLSWRSCLAQRGKLLEFGEPGRANLGLVLKEEGWMTGHGDKLIVNLEATEVETDVTVAPSVLIPYLVGDYKIINMHSRSNVEK